MTCSSFDPFSPSKLIIGLIFIYIIRDFGLGLAQKGKGKQVHKPNALTLLVDAST